MGREGAQRRLLIFTHEAAVAEDIGAEYGSELPLNLDLMRIALTSSSHAPDRREQLSYSCDDGTWRHCQMVWSEYRYR